MWLFYTAIKTAVKRPGAVAAIILSLLGCVFGVIFFDKIAISSDLKDNK
ncbi:MAG: hypothetical protein ACJAZP_002619 [Psychromonas sp.]|jgi:hypothetical protein